MRVTIIPEDRFIRKDDVMVNLPEWNFNDSNIHAIQWYETQGEIEYKENPPRNEVIEDSSILQPYLDALDEYLIQTQPTPDLEETP
jgi:hypothetical protein